MEWHRLSYLFINFALLVFHVPATPSFLTKWWQNSELSLYILGASSFTRLVRRCTTKIWVTFVDTQIVSKVYGVRGFMTDNSVVLTKPPVILSCYETSHPTFVLMRVSQILVVCYISYLHHLMRSLHPRNGVLGPDQDQVGSAGVLLDCWGDVLHTLHNALPSGETNIIMWE